MGIKNHLKFIFSVRESLLSSFSISLIIAFSACVIGFLIGVVLSMIKIAPKNNIIIKILNKIVDVYLAVIRGTPMMLQLLVMSGVILVSLKYSPTTIIVPILAFGINSGAYMTEIIRSGITSVDQGQMEAGRSLGMGWTRTMFSIVIPQAIKVVVPTIFNEIIILVKETSVVDCIVILVNSEQRWDLLGMADKIGLDKPAYYMTMLFTAAAMYLAVVLLLTLIQKLLEKRFKKNER
ncbi:MAG: amino acid ABC transporter permease [Clostridiales bacterium]|nr:amino acid ABC transporter permease [Clostridiales bacterium]